MSHNKRSWVAYETDLRDAAAVHVTFGTPLSPFDSDVRDDGSYIPLHQQEVRDERGRRRLHGAFTGGWSAGYFNTVGSQEGWTPSSFVSSRNSRRKDDPKAALQRPEDYMDEEDLADAAAAQDIRTTDPFAVLGASEPGQRHVGGLAGLVCTQGDTIGLRLLRKMGWKDGQGIGPKVRRKARLGISVAPHPAGEETHLFAPEDVDMIAFSRKADRKGLGYDDETRLPGTSGFEREMDSSNIFGDRDDRVQTVDTDEEDVDSVNGPKLLFGSSGKKQSKQRQRGGFGVGIMNDTGSDEDDPYEIGPRISYNRVTAGDKAKRKKRLANVSVSANPTLRSKPVFISKPTSAARGQDKGKCLDGRPPLNGFTLGRAPESRLIGDSIGLYSSPNVPAGWVSTREAPSTSTVATYVSTADAAKAVQLDPKSRGTILGEASLPGRSVFDFMSSASKERLAKVSGKSNLPPAKGEIPADCARPTQQQLQDGLKSLPILAKETATAAMSRGVGAGGPYANDDAKRGRYRLYLQSAAGFGCSPAKPPNMTDADFFEELQEFYNCAQLFKPMTGFMATRFTTASTGSKVSTGAGSETVSDDQGRQTIMANKPLNTAEEAAKMGMYGRMTRLTEDFYPTRLLCKRFNVRLPTHVQQDEEPDTTMPILITRSSMSSLPASTDIMDVKPDFRGGTAAAGALARSGEAVKSASDSVNKATRPGSEVFKAIFGESSDDDK